MFPKEGVSSIIGTLSYLISIPLSLVNVTLAYICFAFPAIIFFIPDGVESEFLAEKVEQHKASDMI